MIQNNIVVNGKQNNLKIFNTFIFIENKKLFIEK